MKKILILAATAILTAGSALAQTAGTVQTNKSTESKPAKAAMPQTDDEIQKCIATKLSAAPKLGKDNIQASVSGGVATLTGNVPDPGSKGGASSIAKRCGAKSVVNNITFTAKPKAAPKQAKSAKPSTNTTAPPSK